MTAFKAKTPYRASPAQMRVLTSPVRIEIIGVFQSYGPLAIRELAEKLGRPMDGLYHHIRRLQKAGIVRLKETRRAYKRDEAVFELTADRFGHEAYPATPQLKRAVAKAATAMLRLTNRDYHRALADEGIAKQWEQSEQAAGQPAVLRMSQQKSWLTKQDLREVHRRIAEIESYLRERLHGKKGIPFALTTVLVPLVKRKRV